MSVKDVLVCSHPLGSDTVSITMAFSELGLLYPDSVMLGKWIIHILFSYCIFVFGQSFSEFTFVRPM